MSPKAIGGHQVIPEIHHGDCIEVMRTMPDSSVDSIVTDPPYGLGFMGKAWDRLPPGEDWALECLRVLKPGGHLLAFGGTRTWHRLAVAVEDAGFEIRDSIAWLYGSGFPKHSAALKPAFEPIVMGRKPFKGSLAANEALHGTGGLSVDGCRIAWESERDMKNGRPASFSTGYSGLDGSAFAIADRSHRDAKLEQDAEGRWPPNVVIDTEAASAVNAQDGRGKASRFFGVFGRDFDCCDSGACAQAFRYIPKAHHSERPSVQGVSHPTVKPLALMRWLVRLVTPAGGTVLEPFAGSGTTVEACILEGFHCIAIEREAEYLPLIQARINRQDAA